MATLRAAVAALSCLGFAGVGTSPAPAAAPNVTFTAAGTFASTPTSGSDSLKLANEPFTISVVANAAAVPISHGPNWAVFSPLKMTGVVHSGLLGPTPVSIASYAAGIEQLVGPQFDEFVLAVPVRIVGINLTIHATVFMPPGTIPNQLIHIFGPVPMNPSTATVTYSDGYNTTSLAIQTGTLSATVTGSSKNTVVRLGALRNP
ncbi:MAG TPA: hypothetical protein VMI94_05060 [Bryobacteraceae bacterium]|nr:hypothetical protein [Bryobacteraceae bacterium]